MTACDFLDLYDEIGWSTELLLRTVVFKFELFSLEFGRNFDVNNFQDIMNFISMTDRAFFRYLLTRALAMRTDSLEFLRLSIHVSSFDH